LRRSLVAAAGALAFVAGAARAQNVGEAVASWIALDAPTGREEGAIQTVRQAMPEWRADSSGNLLIRRGTGRPRRLIACGMDVPAFAVSEITDDGYLRVHGDGDWRTNAFWAQGVEGQRIRVITRGGWVPGVAAVRSTHLWRRRAQEAAPTTLEDLWVDVGARSRAEVAAMGIAVLDGVVRDWPLWNFAGNTSGPWAAARAGCAAVAAAASGPAPAKGETIFALTAQSGFDWAGLGAVVNALGNVDSITIASPRGMRSDTVPLPNGAHVGAVSTLAMPAAWRGWPAETISDSAFLSYAAQVAAAAGVRTPKSIPMLASRPVNDALRADSLATTAMLLGTLTRTYAVSGFEAPMRAAIMGQLPKWARDAARTDTAGNIVIAAGPERDTVVITAHLDEIGFAIASIAHDGTVTLAQRGGFFRSLWEGQPALLHLDGGPIPGVFVPRSEGPLVKQPAEVRAWFGVDSATLVSRGVRVGMPVTGVKSPSRLGESRFTARSIDDRAGCTALLMALRAIDPAKLTRKTFFLFTVREETGLDGARAFAADHPKGIRRVYAIDTFVSSDSPLESHRFAYAPLGAGPVARALDNSSATPPEEVARLARLAAASGIPLQVGTTNGGNDGSEFPRYGAIDIPIGWPLRYSHSPAEVIDLADVLALGRLVAAVALSQ